MQNLDSRIDKEKGVVYLTERERTELLIKPILRGRDIKRYSYDWAGLWIINTHNGYVSEALPFSEISGRFDFSRTADSVSSLSSKNLHNPKISSKMLPPDSKNTTPCHTEALAEVSQQKRAKIKIPPIDIDEYPTLKAYFDKVASEGKQSKGKGFYNRDDKGITPYNLRNCAYLEEFAKPKIIYSEIVREPQFYLDNGEFKFGYFYAEATSFILTANCHSELSQESEESLKISKKDISGKSPQYDKMKASLEYLLGLLHSKLCTFAFKEFYAGGGLGESGYRYKKAFLENLPIPKITQSQEAEFIKIVNEIIKCKKSLQYSNLKSLSQKGVYPPPVPLNPEKDTAFSAINGEASLNPLLVQNQREDTSASLDSDFGTPRSGREKDSDNKEELQELESRLDSLESKLNSLVFSLYGLSDEEIRLVELAGGGKL
ncbi:hypothetical protein LS73_007830 [Helicobacter muridarum]|uniref:site-specific DNA-methyltransferase (adenine-specific) n=1 Tax=Helicobacter muridarum TaxID=216 RepID=A0A099U0M2_9HELI|nr:TaqI-like C-terminal specificity domain-containing protein [Helicobacter muridarum]TLD99158.1 hypothetical protein LS73_007830 [Helicobacter muridarum]STQ86879.1 type IIS restriction /modification enzyme, N-terminal half [Helicobacter muridarum]